MKSQQEKEDGKGIVRLRARGHSSPWLKPGVSLPHLMKVLAVGKNGLQDVGRKEMCAIVGARSPEQVDTIIGAAEFRLTERELGEIEDFFKTRV